MVVLFKLYIIPLKHISQYLIYKCSICHIWPHSLLFRLFISFFYHPYFLFFTTTKVDLEIGDTVAVHLEESADKVREFLAAIPPHESTPETAGVKLVARLVWHVTGEVDPWVYHTPDTEQRIMFLTSSSTLNR